MRARTWVVEIAAVVLTVGIGLLLVEADRGLAAGGAIAAPEAALTLLLVVLLASVLLVGLLAHLTATWRPTVSALPVPPATVPLAWLLASVTLAAVGLASVRLGVLGRAAFAPPLTVLASVVLFIVALAAYALHARALARASNPYAVVAMLGSLAVSAADLGYPASCPPDAPEPPPLRLGRAILARRSGYVREVDVRALVRAAARGNAVVRAPAVGGFISRGEPLLEVFAVDGGRVPARVSRVVRLADVRDARTDAAFCLGLLSDVAIGSLASEPGVAEAALDRIGEVLGRLGPRPFPTGRHADPRGALRVTQPVIGWPRLCEIALADIALRGAADPRVRDRLAALVDTLGRRLTPERAASLLPYAPVPRPHERPHPPERRPPMRAPEQPRPSQPARRRAAEEHVRVEDLDGAGV